jgi:hypothetical protein
LVHCSSSFSFFSAGSLLLRGPVSARLVSPRELVSAAGWLYLLIPLHNNLDVPGIELVIEIGLVLFENPPKAQFAAPHGGFSKIERGYCVRRNCVLD